MTEDILAQFAQMQRYAAGFEDLLAEAQELAPEAAEGADSTGTVRVRLGHDGLPTSFHVAPGWNRTLTPNAFGAAVVEACRLAAGERLLEWTNSLADHGFREKVERLTNEPVDAARPPAEWRQEMAHTKPRPVAQVAEDMFALFDNNIGQLTTAPPAAGGSAGGGMLTLTIDASGVTSCVADPRWVSRQTAAGLTHHLGTALDAARADLETRSRPQKATNTIEQLIAEALSLIHDPGR